GCWTYYARCCSTTTAAERIRPASCADNRQAGSRHPACRAACRPIRGPRPCAVQSRGDPAVGPGPHPRADLGDTSAWSEGRWRASELVPESTGEVGGVGVAPPGADRGCGYRAKPLVAQIAEAPVQAASPDPGTHSRSLCLEDLLEIPHGY